MVQVDSTTYTLVEVVLAEVTLELLDIVYFGAAVILRGEISAGNGNRRRRR